MNGASLFPPFRPPEEGSFVLAPGEIHIWHVALDVHDLSYGELELCLSGDEQDRARRFVFDRDRARFVACRGRLRAILARYLHAAPQRINFQYSSRGKPSLNPSPEPPLFFNVSHSQDLALIALRRSGELGVDVEQLRPLDDLDAIARRYFTAREHAALAALPADERSAAFFRCWTRKEAILKATGEGIALLEAVEVSLERDEPARVVAFRGRTDEETAVWRLYHVEPGGGFVGAIAAEGAVERVIAWKWSDPS